MADETYVFGSFQLVPAQRLLLNSGRSLQLGSRALEILITLVECAGETVSKDQLIGRVWPDTVVDEGALRVHVAAVRKALGDGREGNRFIVSNPRRGYSFVAPVTREQRQEATAPPPNQPARSGNLPTLLTRVVGRDEVIAMVVSRCSQHRLLTIAGPGGIGKTTVAIAAAEEMSGSFADGLWSVGLATLVDAALVPAAVGAALGLPSTGADPLTALAAWSRNKRILIVLDCCEHVADAAAALAETVLRAAQHVCILATSREPLRAEGEWVLRLPSLEVPSGTAPLSAAEALGYSAVQLFNERAAATIDGFVLNDTDIPNVLATQDTGTRWEMVLQCGFGYSLMFTEGLSNTARAALHRARELAESLEDADYQLRALAGLASCCHRLEDFRGALDLGRHAETIADRSGDPAVLATADWILGTSLFFLGEYREASTFAQRTCQRTSAPAVRRAHIAKLGRDSFVSASCTMAQAHWAQGLCDQSARLARDILDETQRGDHPLSLCLALTWCGCQIPLWVGDLETAGRSIAQLKDHAEKYSLSGCYAYASGFEGQLFARRGDPALAERLLRSCLESLRQGRSETLYTAFLTDLAEVTVTVIAKL